MTLDNITFILCAKLPEDTKPEIISSIREKLERFLIEEVDQLFPVYTNIEVESDWEYGESIEEKI